MSERRLVEVMRTFPTSALGDEAQLAARIPQIADKFHKYAEELTAGTLRDSSGAIAPLRANPTVTVLSNAVRQEVRLSYTDFTVQPTRIIFPAGYRYRHTHNLPGPAKVTMKKAEAFLKRTIGSIPGTEVRGAAGSYRATFLESGEAYFKP
ncbi:MAG: hypothetical protein NDI69_10870 [Bacteriovoracaceae bacterium]|nr:hypothetical protein [Bacteriovoracaceae bacterium]